MFMFTRRSKRHVERLVLKLTACNINSIIVHKINLDPYCLEGLTPVRYISVCAVQKDILNTSR